MRKQADYIPLREIADQLRARVGYRNSQTALARELGVSRSYLNEVLAGKKNPGEVLLAALGFEPHPYYRKTRGRS
jgi:transcriptional regulator with XRE-family HTH domain